MRYKLTKAKFLTDDERTDVLAKIRALALEPVNYGGVRFSKSLTREADSLCLELMLFTGARPSEVLGLGDKARGVTKDSVGIELGDDMIETCFVELDGLKGSDGRRVPIPRDLYERLTRFSLELRDDEKLFTFSLRRLQQIWDDVRPKRKSLRSLRHTFALTSYMKVKDILIVKSLLGHRNIHNTLIYMDFADSLKNLRKIL